MHWQGEMTWERQPRKGVGDRLMARLFAPQSSIIGAGAPAWTGDRYQQVLRYRGWTYIGVKAICEEIAGLMPQLAFIRGQAEAAQRAARGYKMLDRERRRKAMVGAQESDELEPAGPNHPLIRLLQNPNKPDVAWTLFFRFFLYAELTGNSYLWKIRNGLGLPMQAYVLPAHWVWARGSTENLVEFYEVRPFGGQGGARSYVIPAQDIIHLAYPGPLSVIDGWAPTQAGALWTDAGESMDSSKLAAFKQGVKSDLILSLDPDFGDPDDATLNRIEARLQARASGEVNTGRPLVLQGGVTPHQTSRTPAEMDFASSGDQNRDWQLAIRKVSKSIAGITEDVNYASMIASLAAFVQRTIKPKLTLAGQVMTEGLAKEYDPRAILYWPDPTPADPAQRNADLLMRFNTGAVTPNEIRRVFGDEPYPHGGDDPLLPQTLAPVGYATGNFPEPEPVGFGGDDSAPLPPLDDEESSDIDAPDPSPAPTASPVPAPSSNGKAHDPTDLFPAREKALVRVKRRRKRHQAQPMHLTVNTPGVTVNAPIALPEQKAGVTHYTINVPEQKPPDVVNNITLPEGPPPVVNNVVNVPETLPPVVNNTVNVPEQAPPVVQNSVNVAVPEQPAPVVNNVVKVPRQAPPVVNIAAPAAQAEYDLVPERDPVTGLVTRMNRVPKG